MQSPDVHRGPSIPLEEAVSAGNPSQLKAAILDPALTEDSALALLKHSDLPSDLLELLSKQSVTKNRKVRLALVSHPKTPRYVSVGLVRQMFTFELMQAALTPVVPADIKRAAEEALLNRHETITHGERLSLARRASGRVAAALLLDPEGGVSRTALDNPRLTEIQVTKAIASAGESAGLVHAVCSHGKWSLRREIRLALLRSEHTPFPRVLEFARGFAPALLREALATSRLPSASKSRLLEEIVQRSGE